MKKLLFAFPIVLLLASGCNSFQQASKQAPVTTPPCCKTTNLTHTPQQTTITQNTNPAPPPTLVQTTPATPQNPIPSVAGTENWNVYANQQYGLSFKYPQNYVIVSAPDPNMGTLASNAILTLKQTDGTSGKGTGYIIVTTDNKPFSLSRIEQDYPTNGGAPPSETTFGSNTFYNGTGGGGGVDYPDTFYFNLKGNLLITFFDGSYPSDDNHVTPATSQIEQEMLATFIVQ